MTAYQCTVAEFIESPTYPVRFLKPDGTIARDYAAGLQPIRFKDFVANDQFVASVLTGWKWSAGNFDRSAPLAVMRCSGCDRDVVIDGTHRVVWFASQGLFKERVAIIELAGVAWPSATPDMQNVCACGCR